MPSSTMSTTNFSNNSGHRRMGSGELDVFEASRYFSGDIDGLPLGFGAWSSNYTKKNNNINKKKSLELIPTQQQQQQQQQALAIDNEKQNKLEKKRASSSCKPPNSPTAKLANYLNSIFFLQRSSKKKSINSKSKNKSMQSLKKRDDNDHHDHHLHDHHESMSFRCYSDCSKSYSNCVFGPPITQEQSVLGGERRSRTISNHYIDRRTNGEYRILKNSYYKSTWEVGDELEIEDDGQSDSSSDLFELRNTKAIGDGPNDHHVYGATSFEVAIASAILL